MKGTLIKKENHYYFWSSDWNPEKNEGFVANSEGTVERKLSLKNCEAIENGYDLDELASQRYIIKNTGDMFMPNPHEVNNIYRREGFKEGFQKALYILGDKKFSVKDMEKLMFATIEFTEQKEGETYPFLKDFIQSLQQTEWDVEVVTEKDCYGSAGICDKSTMAGCIICTPVTYLRDENGCLILRRI